MAKIATTYKVAVKMSECQPQLPIYVLVLGNLYFNSIILSPLEPSSIKILELLKYFELNFLVILPTFSGTFVGGLYV